MTIVKKGFSIAGIILAGIFFLVMLGMIAGAWVVRGQVNSIVGDLFQVADNAIVGLDAVVEKVIVVEGEARSSLTDLTEEVARVGQAVEDTPILINTVDRLLGGKFRPAIARVTQGMQNIYAGLVQVETLVSTMNRMLFFTGGSDTLKQVDSFLEEITTELEEFASDIAEFEAAWQAKKENAASTAVDAITAPLMRVDDRLELSQTRLTDRQEQLAQLQVTLDEKENGLLTLITWIALLVSLVFAWLAFSQVAVIVWAVRSFRANGARPAGEPGSVSSLPEQPVPPDASDDIGVEPESSTTPAAPGSASDTE